MGTDMACDIWAYMVYIKHSNNISGYIYIYIYMFCPVTRRLVVPVSVASPLWGVALGASRRT